MKWPVSLAAVSLLWCACQGATAPDESEGVAIALSKAIGQEEVWLVDQSNSPGETSGGRIHIYRIPDVTGPSTVVSAETIDLGGAVSALCQTATGVAPVRAHGLSFNATQTHAIIAFVVSGHVAILNAGTRQPVACLRALAGAGGAVQARAAVPAPDDSFILVANANGKLLLRIASDYATNTFTIDAGATLDLAACTTPNGLPCESAGIRPDNAPITPVFGSRRDRSWLTLRGGGLLVIDPSSTPMAIVGEYDVSVVKPVGVGGLEAGGHMYLTSGGGTIATPNGFHLYRFPLDGYSPTNGVNTPAPSAIVSQDQAPLDARGLALVRDKLWVFDRGGNAARVFDATTGAPIRTIGLTGALSADPAPELVDGSGNGRRLFVSLRGPNPLTDLEAGSTPGLGIIQLESMADRGGLKSILRVSNPVGGSETADPRATRVRRR